LILKHSVDYGPKRVRGERPKSVSIYTRHGDTGQTRLLSGEAVPKDNLRVKTYGALDELQSLLGMARAFCEAGDITAVLKEVQETLFIVSAELAVNKMESSMEKCIGPEDVVCLEEHIDRTVEAYGMPSGFVVSGAGTDSASAHVARAVCRRCERLIVTLLRREGGRDVLLSYMNRLGDLLFMLAWALEVRTIVKNVFMDTIRQAKGGGNP
jgi:cob(I)alamin adenosyltransferase